MNIENVFGIEINNMKKLFSDDLEKCFYIPAYQRPYSWDKTPVERMWEDVSYGLKQLDSSDDYITFLGSIITMHDGKHESISPIFKTEVPSKVMVVIDGQQRLSTLLLLIISLDNAVRRRISKKNQNSLGRIVDVLNVVSRMYKSPKSHGFDLVEDYPKMIRAYDDVWSTTKNKQYNSPIAKLLKQYIDFVENDANRKKKFIFELGGFNNDNHIIVKNNINIFQKKIEDFLKNDTKTQNILIKKAGLLDMAEELLKPEEVLEDGNKEVVVLVLILRYVLYRVFVAEISAKKEDYAFEMFDSLNTTGDPLTAFETFKPYVVQHESLGNYQDSDSKVYMDKVERFLQINQSSRDKITTKLITSFALSENGTKLPNKLRDQRIFLRKSWNDTKDKKGFVKNLADISSFYSIWNDNSNLLQEVSDPEAATALQFLVSSNHTIAIPLLSRFYENPERREDFFGAVKAIAAFFVLWRSVRTGTAGIDNCYRLLMKQGEKEPRHRGKDGLGKTLDSIPPFSREGGGRDLKDLKNAFIYYLYKEASDGIEIYSKRSWVDKLKKFDIYNNKKIAKFLLIAGFNQVTNLEGKIGHVQKAREGFHRTLDKKFDYDFFESIEHISPQNGNWASVSEERIHTLGNLTLLPIKNNSSIGNKSLEEKELMFKALSAETKSEQTRLIKESKIKFQKNTQDILAESQHFSYLRSLSNLTGWSDEVIESRTENLGGLIWDEIAVGWLGFDT